MPVGFGRVAIKSKGRPLEVMARLKTSIVQEKAETNCLAHALLIAKARVATTQIIKHIVMVEIERSFLQFNTYSRRG
jgi:hypothetical protein